MKNFVAITLALSHTENVERFLNGNTFEWSNKTKRVAVVNWLRSLSNLHNLRKLPSLEPLLFVLVDKICFEERGRILDFLRLIKQEYSQINIGLFLPPLEEINLIISEILICETISQEYYTLSLQDLDSLSNRPSNSSFFCKVKEFHPRRLYTKHPWNEVQVSSLHSVSTKVLFDLVSNPEEPLMGHRFFLGNEPGPALGIAILDGHHRIYELYKRFINNQLISEKTTPESNGDILVLVIEKL
jgi:hypothetical protein